jgi:hypothetical protein
MLRRKTYSVKRWKRALERVLEGYEKTSCPLKRNMGFRGQ